MCGLEPLAGREPATLGDADVLLLVKRMGLRGGTPAPDGDAWLLLLARPSSGPAAVGEPSCEAETGALWPEGARGGRLGDALGCCCCWVGKDE